MFEEVEPQRKWTPVEPPQYGSPAGGQHMRARARVRAHPAGDLRALLLERGREQQARAVQLRRDLSAQRRTVLGQLSGGGRGDRVARVPRRVSAKLLRVCARPFAHPPAKERRRVEHEERRDSLLRGGLLRGEVGRERVAQLRPTAPAPRWCRAGPPSTWRRGRTRALGGRFPRAAHLMSNMIPQKKSPHESLHFSPPFAGNYLFISSGAGGRFLGLSKYLRQRGGSRSLPLGPQLSISGENPQCLRALVTRARL